MRKGLALIAVVSVFIFGGMAMRAIAAENGLNASEKNFIKDTTNRSDMEVQLGKVAQQNASAPEVKDFGKTMETDHTKAGDELKSIATQNKELPSQMEHRYQVIVDKLSKLNGAEFDKKYMAAMVKEHKHDIAEFKKLSKKAKNPALKQWIDQTLPTLEQHLAQAKSTAKMVGVKVK